MTELSQKDRDFLAWLTIQGYATVVPVGDNKWVGLMPLMFHWTMHSGQIGDQTSYDRRWCYADRAKADAGLAEWASRDFVDSPTGWHREPMSGRRRPDGDASREYIAD